LKGKIMTLYLSQRCWGRSCLHLAAALHRGHWRWHFAGIRREIHFPPAQISMLANQAQSALTPREI